MEWLPPHYIVIVDPNGLVAKFDVLRYQWFLSKLEMDSTFGIYTNTAGVSPNLLNLTNLSQYLNIFDGVLTSPPKLTTMTIDKDTYDFYVFTLGSIFGKVMNLYHLQWDYFYFDMTPFTYGAYLYGGYISNRLYPLAIKRRRLYVVNHHGHVWYSWVRIRGKLDITYSPNEFYDVDEIRIYTDQYGLAYKDQWKVSIYTNQGQWLEITPDQMETVINDPNWDWDWRFRRYYKIVITDTGLVAKRYTKVPPNYIKITLKELQDDGTYNVVITDKPISFIRVQFEVPIEDETSKVVHLNMVDTIKYKDEVGVVDNPDADEALAIVYMEPLKTTELETPAYKLYVKNLSDQTLYDIKVYIADQKYAFQLSLDGETWGNYSADNPLVITDKLEPNETAEFYIKGINIDTMPKEGLLVVIGRAG
jgi:hypothetical protein